jgi:glycosyltransferase involved in cell wall biosynthesis
VFELLSAYAKLKEQVRREIGLVFVGDGESRKQLQAQAAAISSSSGVIKFAGFAHREQLAAYYGLAEMLILPTYSDTWGLVVNEAMACGLPVILSSAAGCGVDLVRDGWNGLTIPPRDVSSLAAAMESLASDPGLGATMGTNSAQHISRYSSLHWAHGIAGAIEVIGGDA